GIEEARIVRVGEVRRSLDAHLRPEHDAGRRDRREEFFAGGLGRVAHRGAGLRLEILDDDLLDVAVFPVEVADGEEGLGALASRLPDADEDAGGKGDREPARVLDRAQADGGNLVGGPEVSTTLAGEPFRG